MGYGNYLYVVYVVLFVDCVSFSVGEVFCQIGCYLLMNLCGLFVCELCDSVDYFNVLGIVFVLDVMGFMGDILCYFVQCDLLQFMGLLGVCVILDLQVLFMVIGDVILDNVLLQVGQFEFIVELID